MLIFNKKEKFLENERRFILLVVFISAAILFFIIGRLDALETAAPISFVGMIETDEEDIQISLPTQAFADPVMNEIYVIDGKARVLVYTSDFFPLYTLDAKDGITSPQNAAIDSQGNLYVSQTKSNYHPRNRISVFNACFRWERDIYFEGFEGAETFKAQRIALDSEGNIYVAGEWFPGILIMNNKGDLMEILSPEEDDKKVSISSLTVDNSGKLYLLSSELSHVYVYDKDRKFIFKFGEKGGSSGKLSRPKAIDVDEKTGVMYIVDYMRHAVNVYSSEGDYIYEFGGMGWSEGWFQFPIDVHVDHAGRIIVADFFNRRVQVFRSW